MEKVFIGFVFIAGIAALIAGGFWLYDIYDNNLHVNQYEPQVTQYDMNVESCSSYRAADEQMNATYKEILKKYNDEPIFLETLKKAQRAWLAFRDAEMVARYPEEDKQYHYGSVYPMCRCAEIAYLTQQRIDMLREWVTAEEGDVCTGSQSWLRSTPQ